MSPDQIATKADIKALTRQIGDLKRLLQAIHEPMERDWVTLKEYAEMKGVQVRTVNNWIKQGQLEARGSGRNREVRL